MPEQRNSTGNTLIFKGIIEFWGFLQKRTELRGRTELIHLHIQKGYALLLPMQTEALNKLCAIVNNCFAL